jgi:hypothetical protein
MMKSLAVSLLCFMAVWAGVEEIRKHPDVTRAFSIQFEGH